MSNVSSAVTLIQLSDCHLRQDPQATMFGVPMQHSLSAVLEQVRQAHTPAAILLSGDLSQDESAASYHTLLELLAPLQAPVRWLPGNHDDPTLMQALAPACCAKAMELGGWRLLLLNTQVKGQPYGMLSAHELDWLARELARARQPLLIACHHQPVPVGSAWLDEIGLRNAEAFWALVDSCPLVRAVTWGHVHQQYDGWRGRVRLLATPATCMQFKPDSETFAVDAHAQPGYRWFRLHHDGRLETGVERLPAGTIEVRPEAAGY